MANQAIVQIYKIPVVPMVETFVGILVSILTGLMFYGIKRIDSLDERIDKIQVFLARFESYLPKRRSDRNRNQDDQHHTTTNEPWYSENSGIEL